MGVTVPEVPLPNRHAMGFRIRLGNVHLIQGLTGLRIEQINGPVVRFNAPQVVALPGDAVWSLAGCREGMDHLEIISRVDLVDGG
jgi:hypothetical protein